jgi:hypothetical protein
MVRFVASMIYVNQASPDYPASVLREVINVAIGVCRFKQRWYQFVSADLDKNVFVTTKKDDARPFPVRGGSSVSHETLFTYGGDLNDCSGQTINPNDWDGFKSLLSKSPKITITTSADLTTGRTITSPACTVTLILSQIQDLSKDEWLTGLPCNPVKAGH